MHTMKLRVLSAVLLIVNVIGVITLRLTIFRYNHSIFFYCVFWGIGLIGSLAIYFLFKTVADTLERMEEIDKEIKEILNKVRNLSRE